MSILQPLLTPPQQAEIVAYVNQYRARCQAPPMTYSATAAAFSQTWATQLATTNTFKHSGSALYGENLAYFQGYGTDPMTLIKLSIDEWYNEISSYNFNNPGFSDATGHFTCLVWVASTSFGIGIAINPSTGAADIVLNTSPPGNVLGQFAANVLAPGSTPTPTPTPTPQPTPQPTTQPISLLTSLAGLQAALQTTRSTTASALLINNFMTLVLQSTLSSNVKDAVMRLLYAINYLVQANIRKSSIPYFFNIISGVLSQGQGQQSPQQSQQQSPQTAQTTHSSAHLNAYRRNKTKATSV